jgi:hypothetical protein
VGLALAASVLLFSSAGASPDGAAVGFARTLLDFRSGLVGFFSALGSVWRTSGLPLTVGLSGTLFFCLVALRQLAGRGGEVRVRT